MSRLRTTLFVNFSLNTDFVKSVTLFPGITFQIKNVSSSIVNIGHSEYDDYNVLNWLKQQRGPKLGCTVIYTQTTKVITLLLLERQPTTGLIYLIENNINLRGKDAVVFGIVLDFKKSIECLVFTKTKNCNIKTTPCKMRCSTRFGSWAGAVYPRYLLTTYQVTCKNAAVK